MVEVRRLTDADRGRWLVQRHALWPEVELETLEKELADYKDSASDLLALGAFDAGELIGFAEASIRPSGDGCVTAPVAWLEGIYVTEPARGLGVAGRLVQAVEDWARSKGMTELGSDAQVENTVSIERHARWGFEQRGRIVLFRKELT